MAISSQAEQTAGHDSLPHGLWIWAAFLVSLAALAGSLGLSLALGLKACPLCFYQRTFVMALVGVLSIGLLTGMASGGRLGLLTLPLATAGLGVAVFHVNLEMGGILECPAGILGLGTAPQQSLAMFLVLSVLLSLSAWSGPPVKNKGPALAACLILGGLLALGACTSNPPLPAAPGPYTNPLDTCRRPYLPSLIKEPT